MNETEMKLLISPHVPVRPRKYCSVYGSAIDMYMCSICICVQFVPEKEKI